MRKILLALAICLSPALYGADTHTACLNASYDWFHHSAEELRNIAVTCENGPFSELNYHRAFYRDLVNENEITSSLLSHSRTNTSLYVSARLLQMVLIEQIAPYYYASDRQRANYLNREYQINNEIAGAWLRGYASLAKRLDRIESEKR